MHRNWWLYLVITLYILRESHLVQCCYMLFRVNMEIWNATLKSLLVLYSFPNGSIALADLSIIISRVSITFRHTTLSRTPLEDWSALRSDIYLKTHNNHNRQTDIHVPAGFKPQFPQTSSRPTPQNARPLRSASALHRFSHIVDKMSVFSWHDFMLVSY